MALKVVLAFTEELNGWSETYYVSGTDPRIFATFVGRSLNPASNMGLLAMSRQKLLNRDSYLRFFRISVLGQPRNVLAYELHPLTAWRGLFGSDTQARYAELWTSLLIEFSAGTAAKKRLYLGGLPDDIVDEPTDYKPTAAWNAALTVFVNTVRAVGGICHSRPPASAASPITSFVAMPSGMSAQITPVPAGAPVGSMYPIVLRGIKYPRGWNSAHRATTQTINGVPTVVLTPTRRTNVTVPPWDVAAGGTIQLYAPVDNPLDAYAAQHLVSRKRGRPFRLSRGRRS